MEATASRRTHTKTLNIGRRLDHLYDPVYTLGGARDHAMATLKAETGKLERVPNFDNMFSAVRVFPSFDLRRRHNTVIPDAVPREYLGMGAPDAAVDLRGRDRARYFLGHNVSATRTFMEGLPGLRIRTEERSATDTETEAQQKTIGVQTLYRESEAQTDPYSPDYVVVMGSEPELLTLATLTYGNGLPATLTEVEMIERARERRAFEACLPPITDEEGMKLRRKLMEEHELKEWGNREEEIERLENERLVLLHRALSKRNDKKQEKNAQRVQRIVHERAQHLKEQEKKDKRRRFKIFRKLMHTRRGVGGEYERRDIIRDYVDYTSRVHAPILRDGTISNAQSFLGRDVTPPHYATLEGLSELEAEVEALAQPTIALPSSAGKPKSLAHRRDRQVQEDLAKVDALLHKNKTQKRTLSPSPLAMSRVPKMATRPPTPEVEETDTEVEELDRGVVMLQSLIRGRAIQNEMFHGKEKRLELIKELRTVETLRMVEGELEHEENRKKEMDQRERVITTTLDSFEGEVVGQTLDYLSKELVRLREERRIAAMVMLAERTRRQREAEETGRRVEEERRRSEEDERFRQIMHVHGRTVDGFLQEIIEETIAEVASTQAVEEALAQAERMNRVVDALERENDPHGTIRDLVASFLLPEVEREELRRRISVEERRFLHAAEESAKTAMDASVIESSP